ncbi:beta clamp domain-containing protein [Pontibacillus litoralis]|uniref:DNA polymerase III beta sliding clamp C-terminal domain-containing protein n=1 Tax=Pontibacillus litoralis JSM 072002 TaxID=1385512 RepID=A0A0A5FUM2_9BACI|nr:hypothetical protein [Pontibacillus litoralis]KGX84466.1 hypothetical protein N784_13465 [Pontibacillus litoralis JSM 072002]
MIEKLLKKHAKNFVSGEYREKGLEGIHFHENGSIYVMDAHKLLAIKRAHNISSRTIHYKTGKKMDVKFPDVVRISDVSYKESLTLNMRDLEPYLSLIEVASKISMVGTLEVERGEFLLRVTNENKESFKLYLGKVESDIKVDINVMYFYQVFCFFKDAKVDKVILSCGGPMRPVSFTAENYEIIVMPVRR